MNLPRLVLAVLVAFQGGTSARAAVCDPTCTLVPSPNATSYRDLLVAVTAAGSDHVWAAGHSLAGSSAPWLSQLYLWNGSSWAIVPNDDPGFYSDLYGIAAVSANDVWAVGGYREGTPESNQYLVHIQHWNGERWARVPGANPVPGWGSGSANAGANLLLGACGFGPQDAWAVGKYIDSSGTGRTLIERWDGASWTLLPSPNAGAPSATNFLNSASGWASNDVWAVGSYVEASLNRTLALHWNGSAWSVVATPNVGAGSSSLRRVVALSAVDGWAVGSSSVTSTSRTLAMRWDGSAWSIVPTPNVGSGSNFLTGVAAAGPNDLWAVGAYDSGGVPKTLVLHWDGSAWSIVASPNPAAGSGSLGDVVAASPDTIWAVGNYSSGGITRTLTEQALTPAAPGEVSGTASGIWLLASPLPSGSLSLSFQDLGVAATSYNVYEGEIGNYYSHASGACNLLPAFSGGRGSLLYTPGDGDRYFIVTASGACAEGPSGFTSDGVARPAGLLGCPP